MFIDKKEKNWLSVLTYLFIPLLLFYCVELIQYHSYSGTFSWVMESKLQFVLGYLIMLSIFSIVSIILYFIPLSVAVTGGVTLLLSLTNYYKILARSEPLYPLDIAMSTNAGDIASFVHITIDRYLLTACIVYVACIILSFFIIPKNRLPWVQKVAVLFVSVLILHTLSVNTYVKEKILHERLDILFVSSYPEKPYRLNGFLFSFTAGIEQSLIQKPSGYQEGFYKSLSLSSSGQEDFTPNVIIILSESFWDATLFESVTFSEDPIPFFRSLLAAHPHGKIFSSSTGGGTANVEFEILTGMSVSFLPNGTVAYKQFIKKDTPSIAAYLKAKGYFTGAIHTFDKTFYNRDRAYPLLGIDQFLGSQDLMEPEVKGEYISDMELSRQIIHMYESQKENGPVFIQGISMQNHMAYFYNKYDDYVMAIETGLEKESEEAVLSYVEGLKDADDALAYLVAYFSQVAEPTVILFYGDHFPAITMDKQIYVDLEYIQSVYTDKWSEAELHKMYEAPYVIWNNFGLAAEAYEPISSAYLGAHMMKVAGMRRPLFFEFLDQVYEQYPVYNQFLIQDSEKQYHAGAPRDLKERERMYRLFQYDFLFGEGYSVDGYYAP